MTTMDERLRDADGNLLGKETGLGVIYSGGDLMNAIMPPGNWGGWTVDSDHYTLDFDGDRYWFRLDDCVSSAEVLDKIMQIAGKRWADDACLAGLVRALNEILRPQANLCSFGTNKTLTSPKVQEMTRRVAGHREVQSKLYQLTRGEEKK